MTPQQQRDPKGEPQLVLVVAVETAVRDTARRTLEGAGFAVLTADNAAAALTLATTSHVPVDLLVTTLAMPGLSGPSLAAELTGRLPNLRVLYLFGPGHASAKPEDAPYAPLNPAQLLRRVRAALKA